MTVSADMVSYVSKGQITLTAGQLTYLKGIAKDILDSDNPGISAAMYDHCHALLICHLWIAGDPGMGNTSETLGGYSRSGTPAMTTYLLQYQDIIRKKTRKTVTIPSDGTDVKRADAGGFKIDQSAALSFFLEDE